MKTNKTAKKFDCIEFKRRAQAEIYQEIKDLSGEEEIEYFRTQAETGTLAERWKAIKRRSEPDA